MFPNKPDGSFKNIKISKDNDQIYLNAEICRMTW